MESRRPISCSCCTVRHLSRESHHDAEQSRLRMPVGYTGLAQRVVRSQRVPVPNGKKKKTGSSHSMSCGTLRGNTSCSSSPPVAASCVARLDTREGAVGKW